MSQCFIDGALIPGQGSQRMVTNPATAEPLVEETICQQADIDCAVAAARRAGSAWKALSGDDRRVALRHVADRLRDVGESIGQWLTAEGGLTRLEASFAVEACSRALESPLPQSAEGDVRAVIGPGSSPILPMFRQAAAALLAGETVVMKPAAGAGLATLASAVIWQALPHGVVAILTGDAMTGALLARHDGIDAISFTGSSSVAADLSLLGRPLRADTGLRDAAIVCADADLDHAVRALAWSRLHHGGRACHSSRRIYLHAAIADDFTVRLHQYVGLLEVDNPAKAASRMGPVLSLDAAKKAENRVVKSMREGARLVLGGFRFRPSALAGTWLQPTILADVPRQGLLMREEMAGPVCALGRYADGSDLQGVLTADAGPWAISLYTADASAALRQIDGTAGVREIWINTPQTEYAPPSSTGERRILRATSIPGGDYPLQDPQTQWSIDP